jgi:hypothetical protein
VRSELHFQRVVFDAVKTLFRICDPPDSSDNLPVVLEWRSSLGKEKIAISDSRLGKVLLADLQPRPIVDYANYGGQVPHKEYVRGGKVDWELLQADISALDPAARLRPDNMSTLLGGASNNRRLGITQQGRLGSLPAASAVEDKIAIFYGDDVPHVVRKVVGEGDRYTYVGECYVDRRVLCRGHHGW